jgi:hypothetical protein
VAHGSPAPAPHSRRDRGVSALQGLALATLVLYGTKILHLRPAGYRVFIAVIAVGDVAGGALASRLHDRLGTAGLLICAGMAGAASFLVVGLTGNVFLAAACLGVEATAVNAGVVATLSLRQSLIPAELRGRVSNVFRTVAWALTLSGPW